MQNKGLIKLFAVLFALVSIYQLSFTYIAIMLKRKQKLLLKERFQKVKTILQRNELLLQSSI